MERLGHRTPVHAAQPVRLRELGYDERWLQDWLAADPTRLGLGQVVVLAQELTHATGGSLDILAADGDTYYSVEVQLGEVDASHGFRVLDYWAHNRARYPDKTHVAALLVESADGRFRQALQAIAEYLPLIVVALRAWRGASEVVLVPEPLIVNESLDVGGTVGLASGKVRTEQDWREQLTEEAWAFYEAFVAWTREHLGEVRVDYSPKSYIGLRRGRRVWAPLWFRRDGATVYLPDPDGSRAEEPSVAMESFRERLHDEGLEAAWQRTYNAGSNPISMRLQRSDLDKPVVQELLRASFEILEPGMAPWSERRSSPQHPQADAAQVTEAAMGSDSRTDPGE
jgi:hypothetical protein